MKDQDGGDRTLIAPQDLADIARKLGPALARYGVGLYGPDTSSAESALNYVGTLLDDPQIVAHMAAVATHQYSPSPFVAQLVELVRDSQPDLPTYVTEYTSLHYGSLDRGQEAKDEVGFMVDSAATLASLYNGGVDAALYWDAVDYYQAGHAAITAWGLLRGPDEAFVPRMRYFGLLQILPYLQPGARILRADLDGADLVTPLAIQTTVDDETELAIALVNQGPTIRLQLQLENLPAVEQFAVSITDEDNDASQIGTIVLRQGQGEVFLPPRSIVSLTGSTLAARLNARFDRRRLPSVTLE
jgi:hypothetical protein